VLIRTRVKEIREMGRSTQGVTLINTGEGEKLSGLQNIMDRDEDDAANGNGNGHAPAAGPRPRRRGRQRVAGRGRGRSRQRKDGGPDGQG
jgi:hypothetical protein